MEFKCTLNLNAQAKGRFFVVFDAKLKRARMIKYFGVCPTVYRTVFSVHHYCYVPWRIVFPFFVFFLVICRPSKMVLCLFNFSPIPLSIYFLYRKLKQSIYFMRQMSNAKIWFVPPIKSNYSAVLYWILWVCSFLCCFARNEQSNWLGWCYAYFIAIKFTRGICHAVEWVEGDTWMLYVSCDGITLNMHTFFFFNFAG